MFLIALTCHGRQCCARYVLALVVTGEVTSELAEEGGHTDRDCQWSDSLRPTRCGFFCCKFAAQAFCERVRCQVADVVAVPKRGSTEADESESFGLSKFRDRLC